MPYIVDTHTCTHTHTHTHTHIHIYWLDKFALRIRSLCWFYFVFSLDFFLVSSCQGPVGRGITLSSDPKYFRSHSLIVFSGGNYYFTLLGGFHSSVNWRFFSWVRVRASLLKSLGYFSVFSPMDGLYKFSYFLIIMIIIFCRYFLPNFSLDTIFILLEVFIIGEVALVNMLVVKDVYYDTAGLEWYFIYVWLFIFNINGFKDLLTFRSL